jgi:hypothetical protein
VVQLWKVTPGDQLEGWVEYVDTGQRARFLSENELIAFLRERTTKTRLSGPEKGGTNEANNDRT